MAKRFTSTELWIEDWFCEMPIEYKLYWYYMLSKCNHAGIFKVNTKMFNNINCCNIDSNIAIDLFNNDKKRIRVINDSVWLIEDFFYYQYGKSFNIKNRVHNSIYNVYNQYGIELNSIRGLIEINIDPYNEVSIDDIDRVKDTTLIDNNNINKNVLPNFRQPNIPTKQQVWEFFKGAGGTKEMAKSFYEKYDSVGWITNTGVVTNFTSLANRFISTWKTIEDKNKLKGLPQQQDPTKVKIVLPKTPKYD